MKVHEFMTFWLRVACAGALFGVGCQKSDGAAPCGTSSAGAVASEPAGSAGNGAGGNGAGGAVALGGSANLGGTGSGAAAASDGTGAAAATGGISETGGGAGAPPDSSLCGALSLTECASNATCQGLSGQPIMGDPACLGAFEVVACGTQVGCSPKATRAEDGQGHDWIFPSTCIPASWTNSSQSGTRFDACMNTSAGGAPAAGGGTASGGTASGGGGSGGTAG